MMQYDTLCNLRFIQDFGLGGWKGGEKERERGREREGEGERKSGRERVGEKGRERKRGRGGEKEKDGREGREKDGRGERFKTSGKRRKMKTATTQTGSDEVI